MRILLRLFGGLIIVFAAAAAGTFLWLRSSLPQLDGTVALAGIDAPVEVVRDAHGVPRIRARSDRDAFFALGFVHAQDRLWQMDFQRRLAAGRLSEVLGPRSLSSDRLMRTLGIYRLAEDSVAQMSAPVRAALDAYADGVNAYIDNHRGAWPIEFYALRYRPEPWRPADSLVWGRLMGLFLSRNWREEVLRATLARRLTPAQLEILFPPYPADAPTTLADLLDLGDPSFGSASNVWVLSGDRTETGKPLLANDPHLRLRLPGQWYLAAIDTPASSFAGATVAGVPFPVLGHNGHIAWGLSTVETDVQDLFIERIDPADPDRYLAPGGPRPFSTRQETIAVRGQPDVTLTVRATRHGPVVSDLDPRIAGLAGRGEVVALATPALAPDDRTPEALYHLGRARDWASFHAALRDWHAPHQNIFYADTAGRIGYIAPARVPLRVAGDGLVPAPGWDGSHDWVGWVPYDNLPQAIDPPRGMIANANNPPGPRGNPKVIAERTVTPGWRARRLEALLDGRERHDAASMTAIQMDARSLGAQALLPLMMTATPSTPLGRQALALLDGWDGVMDRDRPQPLIYTAWLRALVRLIFADELGDAFTDWADLRSLSVLAVLTRDTGWCNDVTTARRENCTERLSLALDEAAAELAEAHGSDPAAWRWGTAHQARFEHPIFGYIPVVGRLFGTALPVDGADDTLNRGRTDIGNPRRPYASIHGAGYRGVYDLADLTASRFAVAPGQSGNPLSPHYADLARPWRDGRPLRMGSDPGPGARRLTLEPER